ncbi:MAG: replication-associated recombination protein A, partial [Chitinophagaceae bacterium]|nr:replication-associated recombination protein A [Chitinophagaceae bacterium]
QCTIYLAASPKSNAAVAAINAAKNAVYKYGDAAVPLHLRNAPTKLMKEMDFGKDYKYAHSFEKNFIPQEYLPDELAGTVFYMPGKNAREDDIRKFLKNLWKDKYRY